LSIFDNYGNYYNFSSCDISLFVYNKIQRQRKIKNCWYTFPLNAIDGLNLCDIKIFESVFILFKLFATLSVSTSTAKRSFSHHGESKPTS